MLMTLMLVLNVKLINFSNRVIGIISFERLFPSFMVDTMNWFQNFQVGSFVVGLCCLFLVLEFR